MTSKLKCPFCGKKLVQDHERSVLSIIYRCPDDKCFLKYGCAESDIWQALVQAKQDSKIARQALKDARIFASTHCVATAVKTIDKALETIGKHNEI